MEEKELFRKVGDILNELNDQYKYLSKTEGSVNELEIELFVANASFLADHIRIIQKVRNANAKSQPQAQVVDLLKEKEIKSEVEKPSPENLNPSLENLEAEAVKPTAAPEKKETTVVEDESERSHEPEDKPQTEEEIKFDFSDQDAEDTESLAGEKEESALQPEAETMVVQEVVIREKTVSIDTPVSDKEQVPTVNDLLSSSSGQNTVSGRYSRQPSGDLKSMISLNDKLLFVKDLFNGYSLAYSEAIELLNRFDNFEAADNFLKKNYAVKNTWSEKQLTVDKLYEILNRRLSK